jgi:hypothetical protein
MEKKVRSSYRLSVEDLPPLPVVSYADKGLLLGSCFATEIGQRLYTDGFDVLSNPYGTQFNPLTLFRTLSLSEEDLKTSLLERDGGIVSLLLHSDIWAENEGLFWQKFAAKKDELTTFLKGANWVSITLGTAWVYERKTDGLLCANLHKRPAAEFTKILLEPDVILKAWAGFKDQLVGLGIQHIFVTVSPVIHGRNGLADNSLSKAILRFAAHKMAQEAGVTYFPSLEIVRDELRDYRFYAEDMQHPSKQASDVVYERFLHTYLMPKDTELLDTYRTFYKQTAHRSRHTTKADYILDLQTKIDSSPLPVRNKELLRQLINS